MAEESGTTEVFQRACRHVGFSNAFAQNAFVERFFQERLSSQFSPEDFALVLTNSHLEDELVDFFQDDDASPGKNRHWLFSSAMKNYRRLQSSGSGAGAAVPGFRPLSYAGTTPKVENPPLPRRHKTKADLRPLSDHKCVFQYEFELFYTKFALFYTMCIVFTKCALLLHNAHCF